MNHVLITGASSGIGRQLAVDYCRRGWMVTACGRNPKALGDALPFGNVVICAFDIADPEDCRQALASVGKVDLLILSAGTCEYVNDPLHIDTESFLRVMQTNVMGTINTLSFMLGRINRGGRVAIISSAATFLPFTRSEAYGASKAALDYLARSLRIDLRRHDIHVSLVRPGFVDTPLTRKNTFSMPCLISTNEASSCIREGLAKGKREITFPIRLIIMLRLLRLLPGRVWELIATQMVRS